MNNHTQPIEAQPPKLHCVTDSSEEPLVFNTTTVNEEQNRKTKEHLLLQDGEKHSKRNRSENLSDVSTLEESNEESIKRPRLSLAILPPIGSVTRPKTSRSAVFSYSIESNESFAPNVFAEVEPDSIISETDNSDISTRDDSDHTSSSSAESGFIDIDADSDVEGLFVNEYVKDIYDYLKDREKELHIPQCLHLQKEINSRIRGTLHEWIADICMKFNLNIETYFSATRLVDGFLNKQVVTKKEFQLVGLAAILIASKYEEVIPVPVADLVFACKNSFNSNSIIQMELNVLEANDFSAISICPIHFLRRWRKAADNSALVHTVSKYLCEESVLFTEMEQFLPSVIAAAAVLLARIMTNETNVWPDSLVHYSKMTIIDVAPCSEVLSECIRKDRTRTRPFTAIRQKYSQEKFGNVGQFPLPTKRLIRYYVRNSQLTSLCKL